jgi:lysozyme|tara:strand:+ start:516 stop:983 length:468 start_codon:yes stop_codon:yes gene_type:complete
MYGVRMKTSAEGIALIKKFEGCELEAYQCSASVWTIGYGHTAGVKEGDTCTQGESDVLLQEDLEDFEATIQKLVNVPLKQNEFDALVSWVYNLGGTNLRNSTLLQRINDDSDSSRADIPYQMKRWNRAGGKVLEGLVRRREAEAMLWQGEDCKTV